MAAQLKPFGSTGYFIVTIPKLYLVVVGVNVPIAHMRTVA
jgi:hypothetical protein